MADIEIDRARRHERTRVEAFYRSVGYGGGVASSDLVFVARREEHMVGTVRLCDEAGAIVLRGMYVDAAYQQRGIGRALLARCKPDLDRDVAFCLPYEHLTGFYGAAGFAIVHADELPALLGQRLRGYLAAGQDVVAMRRAPSTTPDLR